MMRVTRLTTWLLGGYKHTIQVATISHHLIASGRFPWPFFRTSALPHGRWEVRRSRGFGITELVK